jgi:hypothetical protein
MVKLTAYVYLWRKPFRIIIQLCRLNWRIITSSYKATLLLKLDVWSPVEFLDSGRIGAAKTKFHPDMSIIVAGLPADENEDLISKVNQLISVGLGFETEVTAVERMRERGKGPGVVKVECRSVEEKVALLRKKLKLRDHPDYNRLPLIS